MLAVSIFLLLLLRNEASELENCKAILSEKPPKEKKTKAWIKCDDSHEKMQGCETDGFEVNQLESELDEYITCEYLNSERFVDVKAEAVESGKADFIDVITTHPDYLVIEDMFKDLIWKDHVQSLAEDAQLAQKMNYKRMERKHKQELKGNMAALAQEIELLLKKRWFNLQRDLIGILDLQPPSLTDPSDPSAPGTRTFPATPPWRGVYSANSEDLGREPATEPLDTSSSNSPIVFLQNDGQIGFQYVLSVMEIFLGMGDRMWDGVQIEVRLTSCDTSANYEYIARYDNAFIDASTENGFTVRIAHFSFVSCGTKEITNPLESGATYAIMGHEKYPTWTCNHVDEEPGFYQVTPGKPCVGVPILKSIPTGTCEDLWDGGLLFRGAVVSLKRSGYMSPTNMVGPAGRVEEGRPVMLDNYGPPDRSLDETVYVDTGFEQVAHSGAMELPLHYGPVGGPLYGPGGPANSEYGSDAPVNVGPPMQGPIGETDYRGPVYYPGYAPAYAPASEPPMYGPIDAPDFVYKPLNEPGYGPVVGNTDGIAGRVASPQDEPVMQRIG